MPATAEQVVRVIHQMEQPITFSQGWNITVVKEYAPGHVIFGMDEPGYLIADIGSTQINALGETARFQQEESKQAAPQLTM